MSSFRREDRRSGLVATLLVLLFFGGMALSVDFKTAAGGIQSDEATYYAMSYSLAFDGDLEYRREDLERVYREFPSGPSGIFLKRGTDVQRVRLTGHPPFVEFRGVPDPDTSRLYFGKSFIYPLVAAPFVRLFGTGGFLFVNALLLSGAFWLAFVFARAQSSATAALLWAGAFVFASVVPVYLVWTQPELFNWALAGTAMFLWLYKRVSPAPTSPRTAWLRGPASDIAAAVIVGLLTFSKVTNVLVIVPMLVWMVWQRHWRTAAIVTVLTGVVGAAAFGANVASSGEWNYQGGERRTCYERYPLQDPAMGIEVCAERARGEAMLDVIFDGQMFWTNLRANVVYFLVGRNSGVLPYFAPLLFAALAMGVRWRRTPGWQWCVLGGIALHAFAFIVTQPYTYFGGGGTVGNRYFMGGYGMALVLMPMGLAARWFLWPWAVGSLFVAGLIVSPFQSSLRPAAHAKNGPFRLLPVELTNVNHLPVMTERDRVLLWYGDTGAGDPGFQIYYLDDNAYLAEADKKTFWIRGQSRAEFLVKTDRPYRAMQFTLSAGRVATRATVEIGGRETSVSLSPNQSATVRLPMGPGFPYKHEREIPAYSWVVNVTSSEGFAPQLDGPTPDRRFLGVLVKPVIVE